MIPRGSKNLKEFDSPSRPALRAGRCQTMTHLLCITVPQYSKFSFQVKYLKLLTLHKVIKTMRQNASYERPESRLKLMTLCLYSSSYHPLQDLVT